MLRRCMGRVPVGQQFKRMVAAKVHHQRLRESEVIPRRSRTRKRIQPALINTIWAIPDKADMEMLDRCFNEELLFRYASRRNALCNLTTEPLLNPVDEICSIMPLNRPRSSDRVERRNYSFMKQRIKKLVDVSPEIPHANYWLGSEDSIFCSSRTSNDSFVDESEPWEWRGDRESVSPTPTRPSTADYEGDVEEPYFDNKSEMCSFLTPRTDTTCPQSNSTIRNFPQVPFSNKTRHLLKLRKDLALINHALKKCPMRFLPWKSNARSKSMCDLRSSNLDEDCVSFAPSLHSLWDGRVHRGCMASYTDVRLDPRKHFRDDDYFYDDDLESLSTFVIDYLPPLDLLWDSFNLEDFVDELPLLYGISNGRNLLQSRLTNNSHWDDIKLMYDADVEAFAHRRTWVKKYGHDQPLIDRARKRKRKCRMDLSEMRLECSIEKLQRKIAQLQNSPDRTRTRCVTRTVARPGTPIRPRIQESPGHAPAASNRQKQDTRSRFSKFRNLFRRKARVHPLQEEVSSLQQRDEHEVRWRSKSSTNARRESQDRPPRRKTLKKKLASLIDSVKLTCGGEKERLKYEQRMRRKRSRHRREMQLRDPSSAPTSSHEEEEIRKTDRRSRRVQTAQYEQPKRKGFRSLFCCFGVGKGGVNVVDRR